MGGVGGVAGRESPGCPSCASSFWLDVEAGVIVGSEVLAPDAPPEAAVPSLLQSMHRPMAGAPRQPGRLRVADPALAAAVREQVGPETEVVVAPTPELDDVLADMNALIHQDLFITGAGPMVEIFDDRMEITNPGQPLIDTARFLDSIPRSRNEAVASLMRRIGICEERGSGVDKVVFEAETFQFPAPLFEVANDSTRAVLFSHRPLSKMDRADRVRACYLHACLRYVCREAMTNQSLRARFGIDPKNAATASRLIREALEEGVIVPAEEGAAKKLMRYLPWWAVGRSREGAST